MSSDFQLGQRVKVERKEGTGTIRFIGATQFKEGVWIGIEMDEPTGKHDGTVDGVSYFTCRPRYGLFVKPESVRPTVGQRHTSRPAGGQSAAEAIDLDEVRPRRGGAGGGASSRADPAAELHRLAGGRFGGAGGA